MILTKRPERMATFPWQWQPHMWAGTTVGHRGAAAMQRLADLKRTTARIRFISAEPLLEDLTPVDLSGIHQVLVGGESGSGFRPMNMQWARNLKNACVEQRVSFFFKQDSAFRTETRCYLVEEDGSCWRWHQWPDDKQPPARVQPDSAVYHRKTFNIL